MEEGIGPRVPRFKGSKVQGPKDQDISNSNSNTSLTLKKVHLVLDFINSTLNDETIKHMHIFIEVELIIKTCN